MSRLTGGKEQLATSPLPKLDSSSFLPISFEDLQNALLETEGEVSERFLGINSKEDEEAGSDNVLNTSFIETPTPCKQKNNEARRRDANVSPCNFNSFNGENDDFQCEKSVKNSVLCINNGVKCLDVQTPAGKQQEYAFKTPVFSSYKPVGKSNANFTKTPCFAKERDEVTPKGPKVQFSAPFIEKSKPEKYASQSVCKPRSANENLFSSHRKLPTNNASNKENVKNIKEKRRKALFEDTFKSLVVKDTEYVILRELGKGGSSVVYHCYDPLNKNERAIKKVSLNEEMQESFINEVKLLLSLQKCDRVITMYNYEILPDKNVMYVVLEKGDSDLSSILKSLSLKSEHLPLHMLIFYWMEMLLAVKQIHDNGIIHSDLKPANFLKTGAGLKLIDFGIATCMQIEATSIFKDTALGTFNYISPESLNNESLNGEDKKYKISFKSDVWSLGCILYQLVYKKTPFQHIKNAAVKFATIIDKNHKIDFPHSDWVPQKIMNQLKACLIYNMKSRPSIHDLINDCQTMI